MNPALPAEAVEFGAGAEKAFAALGAVDTARRAEAEPDHRRGVGETLQSLGIAELDPRADLETAAAAGELCRAAGRVALPYPVVAVLLRGQGSDAPFAVVATSDPADGRWKVDHGDLFPEWEVAAVNGAAAAARPAGGALGSRLGPFVTPLVPTGAASAGAGPTPLDHARANLHLTLTGWLVLGYVERALELAVAHVTGRVQFGQPLSAFQAVQFQLADVAVAVDGLRELCRYTLWRVMDDPAGALADALALRVQALDAARAVMRTCQQLHGAAGMCDEYDISILVRHVQPTLRLPWSAEHTVDELAAAVDRSGFSGLFPHGARA